MNLALLSRYVVTTLPGPYSGFALVLSQQVLWTCWLSGIVIRKAILNGKVFYLTTINRTKVRCKTGGLERLLTCSSHVYINDLVEELSNASVGLRFCDIFVNNKLCT